MYALRIHGITHVVRTFEHMSMFVMATFTRRILIKTSKRHYLKAHNWLEMKNHFKIDFWETECLSATKCIGKND